MAISARATDVQTITRLECSIPSSHDDAGALACVGDLQFLKGPAQDRCARNRKSIPLIQPASHYTARVNDCLGRDILSARQIALRDAVLLSFHLETETDRGHAVRRLQVTVDTAVDRASGAFRSEE